mmetsp:Transcript_28068/g.90477  ORF Transcript_28068/g.90477 Transcript_28068/m.90477 type:complete len:274 (+) Transcript_28068:715-1536(+)
MIATTRRRNNEEWDAGIVGRRRQRKGFCFFCWSSAALIFEPSAPWGFGFVVSDEAEVASVGLVLDDGGAVADEVSDAELDAADVVGRGGVVEGAEDGRLLGVDAELAEPRGAEGFEDRITAAADAARELAEAGTGEPVRRRRRPAGVPAGPQEAGGQEGFGVAEGDVEVAVGATAEGQEPLDVLDLGAAHLELPVVREHHPDVFRRRRQLQETHPPLGREGLELAVHGRPIRHLRIQVVPPDDLGLSVAEAVTKRQHRRLRVAQIVEVRGRGA